MAPAQPELAPAQGKPPLPPEHDRHRRPVSLPRRRARSRRPRTRRTQAAIAKPGGRLAHSMQVKRVLVALAGSSVDPDVIRMAVDITKPAKAEIVAIHVIE